MPPVAPPPSPFERSARRDPRVWLSLIAGAGVTAFATIASQREACSVSGSCSQVLTAVVTLVGLMFFGSGGVALWRNGRRGARIDPASGELEWWLHRRAGDPGLGGRIHPRDIARIVIDKQRESTDEVHLIGTDGLAREHFGPEVLPWKFELWAEQLAEAWPHIVVETKV